MVMMVVMVEVMLGAVITRIWRCFKPHRKALADFSRNSADDKVVDDGKTCLTPSSAMASSIRYL